MTSGIEDCRWKTSASALRRLLEIHPGERNSRCESEASQRARYLNRYCSPG